MNGILLVNKPKGITSHDVVAKVRRVFDMKAVGHAGTLDPIAEGLLIILLGEATKFSNHIMGQDKKYSAEIQLGLETDSWDAEGELISSEERESNIDISKERILKATQKLQGALSFKVPVHSAVKVNGKKLYDYARKNQEIEVPTRVMNFYKSELVQTSFGTFFIQDRDYKTQVVHVDLDCEKGSYIRSWVHHFGQELGCGAMMSGLVRHQSGTFKLENAIDYNHLIDLDQMRRDLKNKNAAQNQNVKIQDLKVVEEHLNPSNDLLSSEVLDSKLKESLALLVQKIIDLKDCFHGPFHRASENEIRLLKNGQVPNDLYSRISPTLKKCQINGQTELVRVFNSNLSQMVAILELGPTGRPKIIRAFQNL